MARQIDYRDKKGLKQRKEIENKIDTMSKYEMYDEFNLRGLGGSSVSHDENEKYSYVAPSEVRDKLINSMEEDLPETPFQRNQRKRKGVKLM